MEFKLTCLLDFSVILIVVIYPCDNSIFHSAPESSLSNSSCLILHEGNVTSQLTEWFDDECHRFRCETKNGKEEIVVTSCEKPLYPENSIHCKAINLHNTKDEYPKCCPRLKCLLAVKADKYVQDVGQPGETFAKIHLTSNQEIIDNYDDLDYHAMSARHQAEVDAPNKNVVRSPEVLVSKDYAAIFEDDADDSSNKKLGGIGYLPKLPRPAETIPEPPEASKPKNFLEWMLWPLRGMFSSRMEVLGITRFSLNHTRVRNRWSWVGRDTYFDPK